MPPLLADGFWETLVDKFSQNFLVEDRWRFIATGLLNTLIITLFALVIGLALGFLVAYTRVTHDNTGRMRLANVICKGYISVIRGT
ncbi:MAG: hypothetical protein AB7V55_00475, partial [Oscillospiraceae bacterium]